MNHDQSLTHRFSTKKPRASDTVKGKRLTVDQHLVVVDELGHLKQNLLRSPKIGGSESVTACSKLGMRKNVQQVLHILDLHRAVRHIHHPQEELHILGHLQGAEHRIHPHVEEVRRILHQAGRIHRGPHYHNSNHLG